MANSRISDFAKRPTKEKVMIFAIIGALLGGLYWQFIYKSAKTARVAAEERRDGEQARKGKLAKDKRDRDELLAKSDELKRTNEANQRALPTTSELPAFFEMLNRKVGEAGVEVLKWNYKKDIILPSFVQVPLEIAISGTFMQIKRFMASIDTRSQAKASDGSSPEQDRIITIESFKLRDPTVKNRELVLTASFTASTFRQDAPAVDPAAAAAAAAAVVPVPTPAPTTAGSAGSGSAKPATGSGSSTGAATNPVTGAKLDVNAAMAADQQRIDAAAKKAAVEGDSKMGGNL